MDMRYQTDSSRVRELGWNPRKTSFEQLVSCMVNHDLQLCEALVRMKERWPNLPIDSFKSAFLREVDLQSKVDPRYKVESISQKE